MPYETGLNTSITGETHLNNELCNFESCCINAQRTFIKAQVLGQKIDLAGVGNVNVTASDISTR